MIELDRGVVEDDGSFPATLFSEAEASDGHILSVKGGTIPRQMPMFVNHYPSPREQLGSIFEPRKVLDETPKRITIRGQIELGGESAMADIRRDVHYMMQQGHVSRMSGRWSAERSDTVYRTELPPSHEFYVSPEDKTRKRWGMLFKRWTGDEGSVVGLNADPKAVVGRSQDSELPEHVRSFWRAFGEVQDEETVAELETIFALIGDFSNDAREKGAELADIINAINGVFKDVTADNLEPFRVGDDGPTIWLPRDLIIGLQSRERAFASALDGINDVRSLNTSDDASELADDIVDTRDDGGNSDDVSDDGTSPPVQTQRDEASIANQPTEAFFERFEKSITSAAVTSVKQVLGRV
jgi:hypothetical protein